MPNHKEGEAYTLGNIGILYEKLGEIQEAEKYLKSSLTIIRKHKFSYGKDIFEKALMRIKKLPKD